MTRKTSVRRKEKLHYGKSIFVAATYWEGGDNGHESFSPVIAQKDDKGVFDIANGMFRLDRRVVVIYKEYPAMTRLQAYKSLLVDFPPTPSDDLAQSMGWLSPDGLFYKCFHQEHGQLARQICVGILHMSYDSFEKNEDAEHHLESHGWGRVYENGRIIINHYQATHQQCDSLQRAVDRAKEKKFVSEDSKHDQFCKDRNNDWIELVESHISSFREVISDHEYQVGETAEDFKAGYVT